MKKLISLALATIMMAAALVGCGSAASTSSNTSSAVSGGDSDTLTLIVASNQTSLDNPYSFGLDKFKEVAEEVSGGKIQVVVHKGTLGENESELIEKLNMGAAHLVVASPGFMTAIGVPEIDIFSLEYLFDSFDHWMQCVDGDFGNAMKDIVSEKTGNQFRIMGYWSSSVRDVYAKKAVKTPADLKGIALRAQSSNVQQEFWKACGAVPTSVAWGELYQALQQGVVDGAENDYTNLMQKEHHKTDNGKYISETHHDYTTRLWLMDGNFYNSLTKEQQGWIDEASKAATATEREVTFKMYEESKAKCIADGAIVTENADIDIDAFKALAIPVQDAFAEQNNMTEQLEMIRNAVVK